MVSYCAYCYEVLGHPFDIRVIHRDCEEKYFEENGLLLGGWTSYYGD